VCRQNVPVTVFRALTAGAAGAWVANAIPSVTTLASVRKRFFPDLSGQGRSSHVALTFDDGPDPASTPAFLDVLARRGVRATFFLLGAMLERAPDLARRMADEGHELGVHGWTHRSLLLRDPLTTAQEITRTAELIETATGHRPRFYRPPFGILSTAALVTAVRCELAPVLWTAWGKDWTAEATGDSVLATLAPDLAGGATVLLHDSDCTSAPQSWRAALDALPTLLDRCADAGWRVGPVGEHGSG
jgi:peptidoglycan/xylan/chitin deacetylase (PgdA/CDA1 family)